MSTHDRSENPRSLSTARPALALILARAGSKGVPGKNAMLVGAKPCAQWTIEQARESTTVGAILLSTDDVKLVDLAQAMGVEVIPRPAELASDTATVDAAARQAVREWEHTQPARLLGPDTPIVLLYANVPIRPAGLIDAAVRRMLETRCDSVQSYAPVGKMHPWWTARVNSETGRVDPWEGSVLNHGVYRRQELPPAFIPDGGVLVVTRRALFNEILGVHPGPHAFFGLDRRGVLTREGDVVDIDSPIDAIVADVMLRERTSSNRGLEASRGAM